MKVGTRNATGLAIGSPAPLDLKRVQLPVNEEQPIAPIYGYAFVSDAVEGLILIDIRTQERCRGAGFVAYAGVHLVAPGFQRCDDAVGRKGGG